MKTQKPCCDRPNVIVMDYEIPNSATTTAAGNAKVTNRHCNACGTHWHAGTHYTRAEWDAYLATCTA